MDCRVAAPLRQSDTYTRLHNLHLTQPSTHSHSPPSTPKLSPTFSSFSLERILSFHWRGTPSADHHSHGAETGEHAEPAEPSERDEQPYGQGLEQQYEHRYEQPIGQQPHEQQSDNPYLQPYQGPYQQPYEQPYEQQYQQPYEQPLQPAPQQPYEQPASYSEPPLPQTGTEPALPQSGTDAERRCEFLEARVWHLERDKEETDARMAQMAEDGAAADRRIARFQDLFESMQATIADLQSEHFRLKRQVEGKATSGEPGLAADRGADGDAGFLRP